MKAPVHATPDILRNAQTVKAQVIWSTKPMAVVPVLAVTRQGGQSFCFRGAKAAERAMHRHGDAGTLGDTVGNYYSIASGLECGRQGGGVGHAVPGEWHAGDSDSAARAWAARLRIRHAA